jgi:hypothetical protein
MFKFLSFFRGELFGWGSYEKPTGWDVFPPARSCALQGGCNEDGAAEAFWEGRRIEVVNWEGLDSELLDDELESWEEDDNEETRW